MLSLVRAALARFQQGAQDMTRYCDWLNALIQDTRGNVAMIAGLCMPVLLTAVSGAIDFSRSTAIGSELQSALDSGVLAAASLSQDRDPEAVVRAYIEAALNDYPDLIDSLQLTVTSDISLNSRQVGAVAEVASPTLMLGMVGINSMIIQRSSQGLEQALNVEVSLVLDISSSMRGSRIDNLRNASREFVEVILAGDSQDATSISIIPYGGTVRLDDSFHRFVTTDTEFTPNGMGYQVSVPRTAASWNGCLEFHGNEVSDIALTQRGYGVIPTFTVWNRGNDWCPDHNDSVSLFLSNDGAALDELLSGFDDPILSDGTGTDIAISWGVRALDPVWRGALGGEAEFAERPAAYNDPETLKVLVVMTDGGITQQRRPRWNWREGWDDPHVTTRRTQNLYSTTTARRNFSDLCDYAKDNGVELYTIAFQVNGTRNRNDMRNCASTTSKFFDVRDRDIASAFSAIAADINQLRLAR